MAQTSPRRALLPVLALVLAAFGFLGYRVYSAGGRPAAAPGLRLSDEIALTPPPPPPTEDRNATRARLMEQSATFQRLLGASGESEARRQFAVEALRAGDALSARTILLREPDSIEQARLLGRAELALARFAAAESRYRAVVQSAPTLAVGYIGRTRTLMAQQKREEAAQALEAGWNAVAKNDLKGRLDLVEEWETLGNLPRALEAAQALAAEAPQEPTPAVAVGRLLFKMERMADARQQFFKLLASHPDQPSVRTYYAAILDSPLLPDRDRARAESALLDAAQRDPQDTGSRQRLGELYQEQERFRPAAYVFTQIAELVPDAAAPRLQLAKAYARLGDAKQSAEQQEIANRLLARDRAESRLTAQRDQRPTAPQPRLALARHYQAHGQWRLALIEAQVAYALAPNQPEPRQFLTALYAALGVPMPGR